MEKHISKCVRSKENLFSSSLCKKKLEATAAAMGKYGNWEIIHFSILLQQ